MRALTAHTQQMRPRLLPALVLRLRRRRGRLSELTPADRERIGGIERDMTLRAALGLTERGRR